jgi:hypothetical protein
LKLIATSHHQETWDPNWNLRTLVLSLRGFMTTQAREIGGISSSREDQLLLARASRRYICKTCGLQHASLLNEGPILLARGFLGKDDESVFFTKNNKRTAAMLPTSRKATKTLNRNPRVLWNRVIKKKIYRVCVSLALFMVLCSAFSALSWRSEGS